MNKGLTVALAFGLGFLVAKGLGRVLPFALGVAVGVAGTKIVK